MWSSPEGALSTYVATAIALPLLLGTTLAGSMVLRLTGVQASVKALANVAAQSPAGGRGPTVRALRRVAAAEGLDPSRLVLSEQPVASPPGYVLLVLSYRPSLSPFVTSVLSLPPTAVITASTLVPGQP